MVFNCGVVPVKATETLYKDFRIEYSVVTLMLLGTFEMTTCIRIWMWKLSIASSKSMLKVMNNDFNGTST
jgi:hypothetical protein